MCVHICLCTCVNVYFSFFACMCTYVFMSQKKKIRQVISAKSTCFNLSDQRLNKCVGKMREDVSFLSWLNSWVLGFFVFFFLNMQYCTSSEENKDVTKVAYMLAIHGLVFMGMVYSSTRTWTSFIQFYMQFSCIENTVNMIQQKQDWASTQKTNVYSALARYTGQKSQRQILQE